MSVGHRGATSGGSCSVDPAGAAVTEAPRLPAYEAASLLHVSPATLRTWEQGFDFPTSVESTHPVPEYLVAEVLALQDALSEALSISSAIHAARQLVAPTF